MASTELQLHGSQAAGVIECRTNGSAGSQFSAVQRWLDANNHHQNQQGAGKSS